MMNFMSPYEALKGATIYAAKALQLQTQVGSLRPDMRADFVRLPLASVDRWLYQQAPPTQAQVFIAGVLQSTQQHSDWESATDA